MKFFWNSKVFIQRISLESAVSKYQPQLVSEKGARYFVMDLKSWSRKLNINRPEFPVPGTSADYHFRWYFEVGWIRPCITGNFIPCIMSIALSPRCWYIYERRRYKVTLSLLAGRKPRISPAYILSSNYDFLSSRCSFIWYDFICMSIANIGSITWSSFELYQWQIGLHVFLKMFRLHGIWILWICMHCLLSIECDSHISLKFISQ